VLNARPMHGKNTPVPLGQDINHVIGALFLYITFLYAVYKNKDIRTPKIRDFRAVYTSKKWPCTETNGQGLILGRQAWEIQ